MPTERPAAGPLDDLLRQACDELRTRLRAGQPCPAEALLEIYPSLAAHPSCALDLVLTEFLVRQELGEDPDPKQCLGRFPQWAGELSRRFRTLGLRAGTPPEEETTDGLTVRHPREGADTVEYERRPTLGHYELLEEVGRGGMGVVFRARDTRLDRVVAVKMIRSGALAEPAEVDRFHREARAAARIQHPHIVAVYELGDHGGQFFLSMALARGGSLDRHRDRFREPRAAAGLMEKVARAVGAAHERGIVHRDLKPSNVLLGEDDEPLVSDFGLAKFLYDDAELTQPGQRVGTPAYMAPEQAAAGAGPISPAADVWSLGVLLYELLTGRRPFLGSDPGELTSSIRTADPVPPRRLCRAVDRGLEAIILCCLEKDPARRYRCGTELADDLRSWLNGEPARVRPPRWPMRVVRWVRRHLAWCVTTLLLLAAASAIPVAYWLRDPGTPDPTPEERLLRGEAVTLVGVRGGPARSRWVTEPAAVLDAARHEHAFTMHGMSLYALELSAAVPLPRYRLRAQVRHVEGDTGSRVGLYCLYNCRATPDGLEHFQGDLTLNDKGPGPARVLHLALRRYHASERVPRVNNTSVAGPVRLTTPPPAVNKAGPWHDLALVVTPQRVQAFLGDTLVGTLERRDFPQRTFSLFDGKGIPADLPPPFPVGGGLGLFVYRGAACFRNVVLEPLPPDSPDGGTAPPIHP
jgi:hypothetical protein